MHFPSYESAAERRVEHQWGLQVRAEVSFGRKEEEGKRKLWLNESNLKGVEEIGAWHNVSHEETAAVGATLWESTGVGTNKERSTGWQGRAWGPAHTWGSLWGEWSTQKGQSEWKTTEEWALGRSNRDRGQSDTKANQEPLTVTRVGHSLISARGG